MAIPEIQQQTTGQLVLLNIIREIMNSMGENLPFGHGMRSYANLERRYGIWDTEKDFPRAYLYPVSVEGSFDVAGQLENTFVCKMDFLDQVPGGELGCTPEQQEKILTEMYRLSGEFLIKLNNHPDVMRKSLVNINREPNYFVFDANLCGWLVSFEVKVNEPNIC